MISGIKTSFTKLGHYQNINNSFCSRKVLLSGQRKHEITMSKNEIVCDLKTVPEVHHFPQTEIPEFHKQYGLWIFRCATGTTVPDCYDRCRQRYFDFFSISHMYSGKGRLWLGNNRTVDIEQGDCVIITPGTLNRYGSIDGFRYSEDVVNFTGPVADMLMNSGIISNGVFSLGHSRRLLAIQEYAADPAIDSQLRANIELQKLLTELYLKKNSLKKPEYPLLETLLEELRENPEKWWTVREMAEYCNLCVDQLRRVFFQRTGVTPKAYVEKLKISRAAEYLSMTNSSIAETAARFGYQDQYHFSRRFKIIMGGSPREYRKNIATIYHRQPTDSFEQQ